jgi:hypothetical protein
MTANSANYPAMTTHRIAYSQSLDPVRARVNASQQLTNDQLLQAAEAAPYAADVVHLPRITRGPHPGDILYWVTCVGGACLLLIEATT